MKIAIIGAGWFGCHLASVLKKRHEVTIFERESDIFQRASGFNQYRLHNGLHYPRSHATRRQILASLPRFLETYGEMTEEIKNNIYAVAKNKSLMDFATYLAVLRSEKINFEIVDAESYGLINVEGCVRCKEKSINTAKAKNHFRALLDKNLRFDSDIAEIKLRQEKAVINEEAFDYAIDCTYGQLGPRKMPGLFYEADLVLTYRNDQSDTALTIMDGALASFYPYHDDSNSENQYFTLTSVRHTPLKKFRDIQEARTFIRTISEKEVEKKRPLFERVISRYYPGFSREFLYQGFFTSIKTKLTNSTCARELAVTHKGRVSHILSGKISHVFLAEDAVTKQIQKFTPPRKTFLFSTGNDALIGHTGFVGQNLAAQHRFSATFNSQNIEQIRGKKFGIAVCAGARGTKWLANQNPAEDWQSIQRLIASLQEIECDKFILISTVDVYNPPVKVNEDWKIVTDPSHAYGRHRLLLEKAVARIFPDRLTVRLPGIFGNGLKKNAVFDFIHGHNLEQIHQDGVYQYYCLDHLWTDINKAIKNNLKELNIATEPISIQEISLACRGEYFKNSLSSVPPHYDFHTKHAGLWSKNGNYLYDKETVLNELKSFAENSSRTRNSFSDRRVAHTVESARTESF